MRPMYSRIYSLFACPESNSPVDSAVHTLGRLFSRGLKMKTLDIMAIPLTQGLFALVDGEDYERISQHKWYAHKARNAFYAVRKKTISRKMILMHREIMNTPPNVEIDHRNHCTLDNRKPNIRLCTRTQNQQNRNPQKNTSSKFKGICWKKEKKKWRACIKQNRKQLHLGYFNSETDAAKAYDTKARELFGEFANTNF